MELSFICSISLKVPFPKTPIVPIEGIIMSIKHLFILLSVVTITAGCNMMDRQSTPKVATPPPYWQSQSQLEANHLAEMRAFHERKSAEMSEGVHVFRNREMERLTAAGRDLEREREGNNHQPAPSRESVAKASEQRKKWSWTNLTSVFR